MNIRELIDKLTEIEALSASGEWDVYAYDPDTEQDEPITGMVVSTRNGTVCLCTDE